MAANDMAGADEDLIFRSATLLAKAIRERKLSSYDVVLAHISRIRQVNSRINAVVQLTEERALREARRADEAVGRHEKIGALHGVPMTIKDSFDAEGIISTGGTIGRANFVPQKDATVVARLRAAGAIVVGKTNTPELTIGPDTENAIYGRTSNPYDVSRTPAGSSGGAASIIAAGGSPLDIGSDTGGSIREPAHVCGIAALKPTAGRVPRTGHVIPFGLGALDSLTQIGPMARYVEDLGLVLPIIAGADWRDPAIVPMPLSSYEDVEIKRLRIAFFTRVGALTPENVIEKTVAATAEALLRCGVSVKNDAPAPIVRAGELYKQLRNADGGASLRRLLIKSGTSEPGPGIAQRLAGLTPVSGEKYSEILEAVDEFRSQMLGFLEDYDAILCPPAVNTAWLHGTSFPDPYALWTFTTSFNLTGWPSAVVRAGTTDEGLPVGVQIVGRPWREDVVLALAMQVQSLMGGYRRPKLSAERGQGRGIR